VEATDPTPARRPARTALAPPEHDRDEYVLVGGGLQNALLALVLLERRPLTRLTLIERQPRLGGNHTWSFHESDVPAEARPLMDQLAVRRWAAHEVAFPGHQRRVNGAYAALTSDSLHRYLSERIARSPHARVITGVALDIRGHAVTLDSGQSLRAELVVDARGPEHTVARGGYQKFVGLELELAPGTGPTLPMLMDATVPQLDGFRFVYCLPWSETRVLVEDTYYSESPSLDAAALRSRVLEYAERRGMAVRAVVREESGVLPIPARLELSRATTGPLVAGYAGALFHPTTGYSLPVALRFALHLAARPAREARGPAYTRWLDRHARQVRFCLRLNRLLFEAFPPEQRVHVLERFYRLPESTIRRFYALETSAGDRLRILCGPPPRGFSARRWLAGGVSHE